MVVSVGNKDVVLILISVIHCISVWCFLSVRKSSPKRWFTQTQLELLFGKPKVLQSLKN